jgi:acyl carrier protein
MAVVSDQAKVSGAVLRALQAYNEQVPPQEQLPLGRDTVLLGQGSRLDSLGLINLLSTLEQILGEELGREVVIVSEEALGRGSLAISTVGALIDYVCEVTEQCPT